LKCNTRASIITSFTFAGSPGGKVAVEAVTFVRYLDTAMISNHHNSKKVDKILGRALIEGEGLSLAVCIVEEGEIL